MLKYAILSTPRCGSSALMACCEIAFGKGSFIREPLNPYEDPTLQPASFRGASPPARAALLCDPGFPIAGIKHVFSPFNYHMNKADNGAFERVLSIPGLRVILLSRRNLRHQFVSIEIANQTGDWWSSGPDALPDAIQPVQVGRGAPVDNRIVSEHLRKLGEANTKLRERCRTLKLNFVEHVYEELFVPSPTDGLRKILSALAHFGVTSFDAAQTREALQLLERGQRHGEMERVRKTMAQSYPSLLEE